MKRLLRYLVPALAIAALPLPPPLAAFDHEHRMWTAVLEARVRDGEVDYAALAKDPTGLDSWLRTLEAVTAIEYSSFSTVERRAFWIDAYNAYTLKLIVDHHPIPSIRKIGGLLRNPFKIAFIPLEQLRGRKISLDTIEHEILRKELFDPRIHAAIVCASRSCPVLRPVAYGASELDRHLDASMRAFLADPARNRWDPARRRLQLSSIFKWFREDFERDGGTLVEFVRRYAPESVARELAKGDPPEVEFLDYDWGLNGK